MTTSRNRVLASLALITTFLAPTAGVKAQIASSSSSSTIQNEIEKQDQRVTEIINEAEKHFKSGDEFVKANKRHEARLEFDKAVDTILNAGIDVRGNPRLSKYYYELIERIHRIEVTPVSNNDATNVAAQQPDVQQQQVGFLTQQFEVPYGDELAKIKLTPTEETVSSEVAADVANVADSPYIGFKFTPDPRIGQFINYYTGRGRATMEVGIKRSGQFMKMARKIFKEEGVPEDITWLGQVESAWLAHARSWAGATGLWQFIRGTGARYDLRQTGYLDERNGFEKATRASARYLKWLANRYGGNWELAMGAYNCGEGNTDRAIARAGKMDFWAAYPYLPQETRNYVPNILAVIIINKNKARYGFGHVNPLPPLTYDVVQMPGGTNLKLIAQLTDSTYDWLRYLNPELRQNMTPKGEAYPVRVPAGKAKELVARFKAIPTDKRGGNVQIVRVTNQADLDALIASTGKTQQEIEQWKVNASSKGNEYVIPENLVQRTSQPYRSRNGASATTGVRTMKAVQGDTARKISARTGVPLIEITKMNGLLNDQEIPAGKEIKLPVLSSNPRR